MASPASSVVNGCKVCTGCGLEKPLDAFLTHPTGLGGRRSRCRACGAARLKAWKQANRERVLQHKKAYRDRYAERLNRERREERDDVVRARERAWRQARPEMQREWNQRRRAQARSSDPAIMTRIAELLSLPCVYCGSRQRIEIDHIVPLSRGGEHVVENLAAACQRCNRSKRDRLLSEWGCV